VARTARLDIKKIGTEVLRALTPHARVSARGNERKGPDSSDSANSNLSYPYQETHPDIWWGVTSTHDFGATWPEQSGKLFESFGYNTCVINNTHETGMRAFGFAVDDTGVR
jgi:hypothetical protein